MANGKEKAGQDLVAQLELIETRSKVLQRQQSDIARTMSELEAAARALDGMKGLAAGGELLVPLGSGVYAYGAARRTDEVLTEIGAGIFVRKSAGSARETIADRIRTLADAESKIETELARLSDLAARIYMKLQEQAQKR